jgi:RNA polymerase sigma-70 factor (ECF subfamily)
MPALSEPPILCAQAAVPARVRPSFAEVYEEHYEFVWRNVRRLVDGDSVVDDLVQEVFIVVLRRLPQFEWRSSSKTWIFGIVRNVVRDHRRMMRRRGARQSVDFEAMVDAHAVGQDASAENEQARRVVQSLLGEMDDDKREVFILIELEEMTAPEVAEALGVTLTTVHGRIRDARRVFEAAMDRYHDRIQEGGPR